VAGWPGRGADVPSIRAEALAVVTACRHSSRPSQGPETSTQGRECRHRRGPMSPAARAARSVSTGLSSTTRPISRTTAAARASGSHAPANPRHVPAPYPSRRCRTRQVLLDVPPQRDGRRTAFDSRINSIAVLLRPPGTTATSQTAGWSTRPGRVPQHGHPFVLGQARGINPGAGWRPTTTTKRRPGAARRALATASRTRPMSGTSTPDRPR